MSTNKIALKNKKHFLSVFHSETFMCYLLSLIVIFIIAVIISNPNKYGGSITQGLSLFFVAVLPGLLPFAFLTRILTSLGAVKKISYHLSPITRFLFNTPGISSYVFLISILSGYPIGAKLISDLYLSNSITQNEAKKMISFCTTSGPIFIIGSVGSIMFGSVKIGLLLYFSHIISSVMCGIILSGKRTKLKDNKIPTRLEIPDNLLSSSISNTIESILLVGAYISIFFLFADILTDIGIFSGISKLINSFFEILGLENIADGIIGGLFEVTRGCKLLGTTKTIFSVCCCCFIISLGGLSITLQSMSFLSKCKIKAHYFIFVKCVHAILSFIVCLCLCLIFSKVVF